MAGRWYYRQDGSEFGPVALPQLTELASTGHIHLTDWVREGETSPWCPVAQAPTVMAAISATRAPAAAPPRKAPPKSAPPKKVQRPALLPPPAPAPAPVPVVKAAPPRGVPAVVMPIVAPVNAPPVTRAAKRKKPSVGVTVGLAVGGVGAVVTLIAVLVMASSGTDAQATAPKPSAKQATDDGAAADAKLPGSQLTAAQVNMTKAIRNSREVAKKGGLKDLISFEVKNVAWANQTGSQPALRVEMAVTNTSSQPLSYASWNSRGKAGAWLVDNDLKFVALADASGKNTTLAPKQTIVETLEFKADSADFAELRLVLPYAAVQRSGQWGYVFDSATLSGNKAAPPAAQVANVAPEAATSGSETALAPPVTPLIIKADESADPAMAANETPEPAPVDDGEPKEDIRDIVKQFKEKEKMAAPKNE